MLGKKKFRCNLFAFLYHSHKTYFAALDLTAGVSWTSHRWTDQRRESQKKKSVIQNNKKMNRKLFAACLVLLCTALVACDRNEGDDPENPVTPPSTPTHVYVAGSTAHMFDMGPAVCWVDGAMQTLDASAYSPALTVCVMGNDVYYGGCNSANRPVIWKNGTEQLMSNDNGCVTDIKTANNKLYACGYVNARPVYWVDGQMTQLPIDPDNEYGSYKTTAIFISGNDIYVAGTVFNNMSYGDGAYLWKNGVMQKLSNKNAAANDVCVISGTVYVVGSEVYNDGGFHKSVMWTNGTIRDIQVNTGFDSRAIAVAPMNGKPYVVLEGWLGDAWTGGFQGFAWYNETTTKLNNCQRPQDVFIHGSDIYIAGVSTSFSHSPILLKNNAKVNLSVPSPGYGGCHGIFVK